MLKRLRRYLWNLHKSLKNLGTYTHTKTNKQTDIYRHHSDRLTSKGGNKADAQMDLNPGSCSGHFSSGYCKLQKGAGRGHLILHAHKYLCGYNLMYNRCNKLINWSTILTCMVWHRVFHTYINNILKWTTDRAKTYRIKMCKQSQIKNGVAYIQLLETNFVVGLSLTWWGWGGHGDVLKTLN